jgi:hypothetical protein
MEMGDVSWTGGSHEVATARLKMEDTFAMWLKFVFKEK